MERVNWVAECAASAAMLGVSLLVGVYFGCVERKQNTVGDYLLGGKKMSVFPITMSLVASHISGISLLGIPSEVYTYGTQFILIGLGNILVITVVMYIFLPVFYELQLTSLFEYLELRFDSKVRGLSSLLYTLSIILYIPVVIYLPAVAFNQVTGVNIHLITPIICIICIFYTTVGGLKAVVWTDAIQSGFTSISILVVTILGLIQVGGIGNMIKVNLEGERIEFFRMNPDPFMRCTFWNVCIGSVLLWISHIAIHPGTIQRFVALPTYKKAKKSLIWFGVGIIIVNIFTGTAGLLMYAKYKDCDPVSAGLIKNDKSILPYYVMDVAKVFPGLTGLFISGIASASLSTMSAQLNTVSGTIYADFVVKMMHIKVSELTASIIMKCIVIVIGIICVSLVIIIEKLQGILQIAISLGGITTGAMLSVFTLGICFPLANAKGALFGMLTSLVIMCWVIAGAQIAITRNELKFVGKTVSVIGCPANVTIKNDTDYTGLYRVNEDVYASPDVMKIHIISYLHYSTLGTVVGLIVGLAISMLFPDGRDINPKLLAPCLRKFIHVKNKIETNINETRVDDCTSAGLQETKL